ncbi:hypothetical protein BT69DRAFT_750111 [Atractiella rhizophila]|nr:hypothetical protein BT69DRAFT_750111 [Atractiella rhizophila]
MKVLFRFSTRNVRICCFHPLSFDFAAMIGARSEWMRADMCAQKRARRAVDPSVAKKERERSWTLCPSDTDHYFSTLPKPVQLRFHYACWLQFMSPTRFHVTTQVGTYCSLWGYSQGWRQETSFLSCYAPCHFLSHAAQYPVPAEVPRVCVYPWNLSFEVLNGFWMDA